MRNNILIISISLIAFLGCNGPSEKNAHSESQAHTNVRRVSSTDDNSSRIRFGEIPRIKLSEKITCTGGIEIPPSDLFSIHSRSEGIVERIHFLPGDFVRRGQALIRIYNPRLLEMQRIFLETKAEYDLANKDFTRKESLYRDSAMNARAYDQARGKKEVLKARYEGLKTELKWLQVDAEKVEKTGQLQPHVNIYASANGYVHKVLTNKGAWVEPPLQLMEIAGRDHIHLELKVPSRSIAHLAKGQEVGFTIPGMQETLLARVEKINPMLDKETNTLQVHCHLEKEVEKIVKAGMFVQAQIAIAPREVPALSLDAVVKEGENYYAFKKNGEELEKVLLINPNLKDDFLTFDNDTSGEWVIAGAYYVE